MIACLFSIAPLAADAPAAGGGPTIEVDDDDRLVVTNGDGRWVIWKRFDPASQRSPGVISEFQPTGQPYPFVDDARSSSYRIEGGLGGFGFFWARRDGCCDQPGPGDGSPYLEFYEETRNEDVDIDRISHAWHIFSHHNAATRGGFGVSNVTVHRPATVVGSEVHFGATVDFSDGWWNPVLTVRYDYEFTDSGVRMWAKVTSRCDAGGDCGITDVGRYGFIKEPRLIAALAPKPDGSLMYPHLTVFDENGQQIDGADLAAMPDATQGGQGSVTTEKIEQGASVVRFDEGPEGCDSAVRECFYVVARSYPSPAAPHDAWSVPWANPDGHGFWGWALASSDRFCYARYGVNRAAGYPSSCNPPVSEGTFGNAEQGQPVNAQGRPGLHRTWSVFRRSPDSFSAVKFNAWSGCWGTYDCPLANRVFGANGESWSVYMSFSYGEGYDLQRPGIELRAPETLRANGATLAWTRYPGDDFGSYEVHRSASPAFTPSVLTRLATIREIDVTSFRDTTASPGRTFTYKVLANGTPAGEVTVTLPADGRAVKKLQPGPAEGKSTRIVESAGCNAYGADHRLLVGRDSAGKSRSLVHFDLRDIPVDATIDAATLSLYRPEPVPAAMTLRAFRATTDWDEGAGLGSCTSDGATWTEPGDGLDWVTDGADFADGTASSPVAKSVGEQPGWESFDVTELVRQWARADAPNLGILVKSDEVAGQVAFASDDELDPALRPKLEVSYQDGSTAQKPHVVVVSPGNWQKVTGTTTVQVAASDDRRVDKVELLVDGAVVATDSAAPWSFAWDSTTVADGSHTLQARAEDDAGNVASSEAVTVVAANSAKPTTSVTSVTPSYVTEVAADQPSGWWRLGEAAGSATAKDASGNTYDGTYEGALPGVAGGLANEADTAVRLNASLGGAPANDAFANATPLAGDLGNLEGTNGGATRESGEPAHAGGATASVWYRWTPTTSGTATVDTIGSDFDTTLAVYTGSSLSSLVLVASNDDASGLDSRVSFGATAGTTYHIAVDEKSSLPSTVALKWRIGSPVWPNDPFASAQDISRPTGVASAWSGQATKESGEPSHAGNAGGRSLWYRWVAPTTGEATFSTVDSTFDTLLAVYTGSSLTGLTLVASNDDIDKKNKNSKSQLKFTATGGTAYLVAVDGYNGASGDVALRWEAPASVSLGDRFDFAGNSPFSLEAWVKPSKLDTNPRRVFSKEFEAGNGRQGYRLWLDNNGTQGVGFVRSSNGTMQTLHAAKVLPPNAWSHLVATYDGTTTRIYVDGQQAATGTSTVALADHGNPLRLGNYTISGNDLRFVGDIDEAAVYPVALSATRVKAHYDAGKGNPTTTPKGKVKINASAGDDKGVAKVEFYVDDEVIAEDTAAPYSIEWNTLGDAQQGYGPTYDGARPITTRAYDAAGQVTTSTPLTVTVSNGAGTKYESAAASSDPLTAMTDQPATQAQESQRISVRFTNRSGKTWPASSTKVRYRWKSPDPAPEVTESAPIALPSDVAAGASLTVPVDVVAPDLPEGVDTAQYELEVDLEDTASDVFFSEKGAEPLERLVTVKKAKTELGLEMFYHYEAEELGGGMQHLVNVASGNSIVRLTPFSAPGRGLATVVDLTYNSLEKKCECPAGNNWSLSVSSLNRFGLPLTIKPGKYVELVDGDGTTHRFVEREAADGTPYWEEPDGVHLYLHKLAPTDTRGVWAFTRPDRVTFFYEADGFPTLVEDGNGNRITFALETIRGDEDPGGVKRRVFKVTDDAGRDFGVTYWTKAEVKKAHMRGRVKTITDHTGSELFFEYYEDGNLLRITQRGGVNDDGDVGVADRSWTFTYTTPDGSKAAIPDAPDRANPNPRTPNQSTRLYSVRDPRGRETIFEYLGPGSGNDRWKLAARTDRAGSRTEYAYDEAARMTTVRAPLSRTSTFAFDDEGKVTRIVNPKGEKTFVEWTERHVTKVYEPTLADAPPAGHPFVSFEYDDNGHLTKQVDQLGRTTELVYRPKEVDTNDVLGKWKAGREIPHIGDLVKVTEPKGVVNTTDPDDHEWNFEVDPATGNVTKVTEPGAEEPAARPRTLYAYDVDGNVTSITDPLDRVTQLLEYEGNGFPQKVVDAKLSTTRFGYDADGLLRFVQDARHMGATGSEDRTNKTVFMYDAFHRLVRQSTPKSTAVAPGMLIWTGALYDPNDNVVAQFGPAYGAGFVPGPQTTIEFDTMDRPKAEIGPDRSAGEERTELGYDEAGRLTRVTLPLGVASTGVANDYVTELAYDELDRVVKQVEYARDGDLANARVTHSCYDLAGDLRSVTAPRAKAAQVDCAGILAGTVEQSFTTTFEYYGDHALKRQTDALGNTQTVEYDDHGNVKRVIDEIDHAVESDYNERDQLIETREQLYGGRAKGPITTKLVYDKAGNLVREISPRAVDTGPDPSDGVYKAYVTDYGYDELDRLLKVTLPTDAATAAAFVHYRYDAVGNTLAISRPVPESDPGFMTGTDKASREKRTDLSYWDTGWVRTTDDPGKGVVRFDYTAQGWQSSRRGGGTGEESWVYFDDGTLKSDHDVNGSPNVYTYDLNDNLIRSADASGVLHASESPVKVEADYDGFDEIIQIRHKKEAPGETKPWKVDAFTYDAHGNAETRTDDGRGHTFAYDELDRLLTDRDDGESACADDTFIEHAYTKTNLIEKTVLRTAGSACAVDPTTWPVTQQTASTYFENGLPDTTTTWSGDPVEGAPTVESHDLDYEDSGVFVNGHQTKDDFKLAGPATETNPLPCFAATCPSSSVYDAQERLVTWRNGLSGELAVTLQYVLDAEGNVREEKLNGSPFRTYAYDAAGRLDSVTEGGSTSFYQYRSGTGNLWCVTTVDSTTPCATRAQKDGLVEWLRYDPLDRIQAYESFKANRRISSSYVYDALDRLSTESETHGTNPARQTLFSYLGLTDAITAETSGGETKRYDYDAFLDRISMRTAAGRFTYGRNVHGDVSLLLDGEGKARASYGYKPYGDLDAKGNADGLDIGLSRGDTSLTEPLNPFRFNDRRFDSGSGTIEMGARRFGPDVGRFLELDFYRDALGDIDLALDPLTQGRYGYAAGNPISFFEVDGHDQWWRDWKRKRPTRAKSARRVDASGVSPRMRATSRPRFRGKHDDYWTLPKRRAQQQRQREQQAYFSAGQPECGTGAGLTVPCEYVRFQAKSPECGGVAGCVLLAADLVTLPFGGPKITIARKGSGALARLVGGGSRAAKATQKALPPPSVVPNAGGKIVSFVTREDRVFYRVFSGDATTGAFLTAVPPRSRAFAREALALPPGNEATFIQRVVVPAGTRLQRSRALRAFGRRGGAEQFELLERIPNRSFGPGVPLP